MKSHPLRGLRIAQFFGAFNDNSWKLMVALLGIRQVTAGMAPGPELEAASQAQTTLTLLLFTLPLMLVSLVAGVLADRVSTRTIIITMKGVEVGLMAAGTLVLLSIGIGAGAVIAGNSPATGSNTGSFHLAHS